MSQPPRKNFIALVSLANGTYLSTWSDFTFETFTLNINGGLGECVLKMARKFDASGNDMLLGNVVELRVADKDTVTKLGAGASMTIYKGYISMIEREANGAQESISIHLLGFYSLLSMDILKNGAQTTLYSDTTNGLSTTSSGTPATGTASDIALMARAVITRYIAETTNPQINFDVADVPLTSTTGTYRMSQKTYSDALNLLRKLAPLKTYFFIGADGLLKFKTGNTTLDHRFVIGKHISRIHAQSNIETMRNAILVFNGLSSGGVYKHYEDADSIATYGRRCTTVYDSGIQNVNAADLLGNKFLAENKAPEVKISATIIDNNGETNLGYDIESVLPGHTCSFSGFNVSLNEIFPYTMLITRVTYRLDSIDIEAEIVHSNLQDIQFKNTQDISEISTGGTIPDSYT